jgi:catechol 2,3-dioxygenase-like lactoylglutathione lyase family enzyme
VAAALHHVSVVTRQPDRLVSFLHAVLGFAPSASIEVRRREVADLLGWPNGDGTIRSTLVGDARHGVLEIIEAPDAADPVAGVSSGVLQLSFAVEDVAAVLRVAEGQGAERVVGPRLLDTAGTAVLVGCVDVAGLRIQVTQLRSKPKS